MSLGSMRKLFETELKDLYSAEKQLLKALPKMAEAATEPELKQAFQDHLNQTEEHARRLERVFEVIEMEPRAETCEAMKGLVKEGDEIIEEDGDDAVRDAALICAAQKVEHYEIASYGSLRTFAEHLGLSDAIDLLQETLDEEKDTDLLLTEIAQSLVNLEADAAGEGKETSGESGEGSAQAKSSRGGAPSRSRSGSGSRRASARSSGSGRSSSGGSRPASGGARGKARLGR